MSSPTESLLGQLQNVKPVGDGWSARCPAHPDQHNSLSVSEGDEAQVLLHCHAGCDPLAVTEALALPTTALFAPRQTTKKPTRHLVARYPYTDERGTLLYEVVRFDPKDFAQRRRDLNGKWIWKLGDTRRVLYRLPSLHGQAVVYVCEGEKDVEALAGFDLVATTNAGGAGKWRQDYVDQLRAAGVSRVVVIPDYDQAGQKHGRTVASACAAAGITVKIVELPGLPEHGDVSYWVSAGHAKAELIALVKQTPVYTEDGASTVMSAVPNAISLAAVGANCFHLTDLGAAEFFADRFGHQVRYDHSRQRWLLWTGHRWAPDVDAQIQRLAVDHLRQWQRDAMEIGDRERRQRVVEFCLKLEKRSGIENMLAVARGLRPIATSGQEWDANLYLMGVTNGVVDLRTGIWRAGKPEDLITFSTHCAYDADATCHGWDAFMATVLPDEQVREFMQLFVGYALTGDTSEQVLSILYGKGSNGKSTMASILVDLLGDYAATIAFSALEMKRSDIPSDIAGLANVRLVLASEVKEGQRMNEARIKALTGGDPIAARHLYGSWFTFKPAAKFLLAVNHKPTVADDSHGFWRRIRLVPFSQTFTGTSRIHDLPEQLLLERDGIFQWALQGCLAWQQRGLVTPTVIADASQDYQTESDPLADFVAECCEVEPGAETKGGTAYALYSKWADTQRLPKDSILRPQAFGMRFGDQFERIRRKFGVVYVGVKLTTNKMF